MTVKQLIEELQKYPEDLEIWVSDRGALEGGTPLENVKEMLAWDAGLDGDDIGDEYIYTDTLTTEEIEELILIKDYYKTDSFKDIISKKILLLHDYE
ncbi:MAG TPA: hypothetical protein PKD00_00035 [Burkholderiales bacterium]|mgnify:CR=1 FL=1|nr:hypothetical protein [Burkholderiales bacterium]